VSVGLDVRARLAKTNLWHALLAHVVREHLSVLLQRVLVRGFDDCYSEAILAPASRSPGPYATY